MRPFLQSQILIYLFLACPGSEPYRLGLLAFWIFSVIRHPLPASLGALWQFYSLHPSSIAWGGSKLFSLADGFDCDARFWFVCNAREPSLLLRYLMASKLGEAALWVRAWTENYCLAWHPLWGNLAFSLIMGGKPDDSLKGLYRSLGFLHVLVISGSQFSLLSNWLKKLSQVPVIALYSVGLIDWRSFRPLSFLADFITLVGLSIYLLACGASPPCQRAFIQQLHAFLQKWIWPSRTLQKPTPTGAWVFQAQALLFPTQWFSLSTLLSWGAVYSLNFFGSTRSFFTQVRISLSIQLLSLAMFSRLSLASLLFDFFISPVWDILLFICLAGIFLPELHLQLGMTMVLNYFHEFLWKLDLWQTTLFGSSTLSFRASVAWWGRLLAALIFGWLFLSHLGKSHVPKR